jgi:hypothetical protein
VLLGLSHTHGARADTSTKRGAYLVNTIMARGNCHTPRDAEGKSIADQALSGGITITSPAFTATAPNIPPTAKPESAAGPIRRSSALWRRGCGRITGISPASR